MRTMCIGCIFDEKTVQNYVQNSQYFAIWGIHKLFTEKMALFLDNGKTGCYLIFSTQKG